MACVLLVISKLEENKKSDVITKGPEYDGNRKERAKFVEAERCQVTKSS